MALSDATIKRAVDYLILVRTQLHLTGEAQNYDSTDCKKLFEALPFRALS